eukprot:gene5946-5834_t
MAALATAWGACATPAPGRPDIVVIVADDLGANEHHYRSSTGAGASQMTPHCYRRSHGYRTGLFGKWHLGSAHKACLPMSRGFDEHVGWNQPYIDYHTHMASPCALPHLAMDAASGCLAGNSDGAPDLSIVGHDFWINGWSRAAYMSGLHCDEAAVAAAEDFILSFLSVSRPLRALPAQTRKIELRITLPWTRGHAASPAPFFALFAPQTPHRPHIAPPAYPALCSGDLSGDTICGM